FPLLPDAPPSALRASRGPRWEQTPRLGPTKLAAPRAPDPNAPIVYRGGEGSEGGGTPGLDDALEANNAVGLGAAHPTPGTSRIVVSATAKPTPMAFTASASGRFIAYLSTPYSVAQDSQELDFDLVVVPQAGGAPQVIRKGLVSGNSLDRTYRWHPTDD